MPQRSKRILLLMVSGLLMVALWHAAPLIGVVTGSSSAGRAVAESLVTFLWVGVTIAVVRNIAGLKLTFAQNVAAMLVASAVLAASGLLLEGVQPLHNLALVFAASFLGCVVSVIFREPNITLPIALMSPLVDYWTVVFGPVRQIIEGSPHVLEQVSAAMPRAHAVQPVFLIGAGDFLFMAMFLSAAERLHMSPGRTAWYFLVLVSVAMLLVVSGKGFEDGLPGLVVIGLGFVAANLRHFRLSRAEVYITSGLAAAVGVTVAAVSLMSRH